jgi:type VI secretion system protein ImpE
MNATELFKAGRLRPAIDAQAREVKANPADHARRLFLFELLAFAGEFDRAKRQIEAVRYDQPELAAAALNYRQVLDAEEARRRLFRDGLRPQFLAPAPEHVKLRLEAADRLREHRPAEAAELLARAQDTSPALAGLLNDKPFRCLRDCDDLFGPVLEVFAKGAYFWVPLEQVQSLAMNPPKFARDLVWVPARLEVREGPSGEVFLPARYPGSEDSADDQVRLGRASDWKAAEGGPVLGVGARTFLVDDDAVSLLEWRQLQMA